MSAPSDGRVLVAYASPHGSTQGVAERIAVRLRGSGLDVDCAPVGSAPEPGGYGAVVVGSALHGRAWLPEATGFVLTHAAELAATPVWLFSLGMPGALARPLRRMAMREGPRALAPLETAIHPRGARLFSGVVTPDQFPRVSRAVMRLMGGRFGHFRAWPDIDAWADEIAAALTTPARPLTEEILE